MGVAPSEPWYKDGLRFACQRSGNCCTGEPGSVRLTDQELKALAELEGLEVWQFEELFVRVLPDGVKSLRERSDGACVLFDAERGCRAYAARPRQCRTWPFWRANLASPSAWEKAAARCPGMGQGPRVAREVIEARASKDGTSAC